MVKTKILMLFLILAVSLIAGCLNSKQSVSVGINNMADSGQITYVDANVSKQSASVGINNMADSGQITYVDVNISKGGIVSETHGVHQNSGTFIRVDIGDQIALQARGGRFIGFCEDRTCTRMLTTQRTYQTTITDDVDIYAVFKHS